MNFIKKCFLLIIFIWQHEPLLGDGNGLDLITQWDLVRKFNTGYQPQDDDDDGLAASDFAGWPTEKLGRAITSRFDQLKCTYLFSAHYHFSLVQAVFQAEDMSSLADPLTLFLEQSVTMVRCFFAVKGLRIDEVWLVYVHAFTMNEYLLFLVLKRYTHMDIRANMMRQNRFVVDQLNSYLGNSCCGNGDNSFGAKSVGIEAAVSAMKDDSAYSSSNVHEMILDNKIMLANLHDRNLAMGLGRFINTDIDESFLKKAIHQKQVGFPKAFRSFPPHCTDRDVRDALDRAIEPYGDLDFTKNHGLQGLLNSGTLHSMIVDGFRFMFLRATFKFVNELKHMIETFDEHQNPADETRIKFYSTHFQANLPAVIETLNLNDDDILCELNGILKQGTDRYKLKKNYVFSKVHEEHDRLSAVFNVPPLENMEQRSSNDEHLVMAESVVKKITGFFHPFEFKLYQSYLEFFNSYSKRIYISILTD